MSLKNSDFKGRAKRLDDIDLPTLGATIGVGEDEIHAFLDVEAAGSGFDRQGRPKALFEPHRFYKLLSGPKRAKAVKLGLAYPKWGERPYPKDSYPRIKNAMQIDEEAALKATSWGLGQVLGENHAICGYNTATAMVKACMDDEENHLKASIDFIRANGLDDELRDHKWAAFARGYNGPGYRKNNYDTKLAAAYRKWSKIPDFEQDLVDELLKDAVTIPAPTPAPVQRGNNPAIVAGFGVLAAAVAAFWDKIQEMFAWLL